MLEELIADFFLPKINSITLAILYIKGEWKILHKYPFNKDVI